MTSPWFEATAPHDNCGLFPEADNLGSVRVRLPGKPALVIRNRVRQWWIDSPPSLGLPGFAWPAGPNNLLCADCAVTHAFLPEALLCVGCQVARWKSGETARTTRVSRVSSRVNVGSFTLAREVLKDHVSRRCLGSLPEDRAHPFAEDGRLSFVETGFKRRHIRDGFLPRPCAPLTGDVVAEPLQPLNSPWPTTHKSSVCEPAGAAGALDKVLAGKKGPPTRRMGEAPAGARLRQRAAWVLSLNPDKQSRELGALLKGRWTPDLSKEFAHPMNALFVASRGGSVKFLGGGTVIKPQGEGEERTVRVLTYVNAVFEGTCFRLYPELLARLAAYATFKRREPRLLSALGTRALEWLKREGFSMEEAEETLAPTVALSWLPSSRESLGIKILQSASTTGALPETNGWWSAKD